MLKIAVLLLPLVTFVSAEPIVHGSEVKQVEYPFLVYLVIRTTEIVPETNQEKNFRIDCGGTIVTRRTILTAAHCLEDSITPPVVDVHAGHVYLRDMKGGEGLNNAIQMNDFIIHPNYVENDIDLALIFLKKDLHIRPGIVQKASFTRVKPGYTVTVAGWGVMGLNEHTSVLRKAKMKVIPYTECHKSFRDAKNFVCVLDPNHKRTFCDGDSGGPLIYQSKVVGVMMSSSSMDVTLPSGETIEVCSTRKPGTVVYLAKHLNWVLLHKK